jgi:hypothetical protein
MKLKAIYACLLALLMLTMSSAFASSQSPNRLTRDDLTRKDNGQVFVNIRGGSIVFPEEKVYYYCSCGHKNHPVPPYKDRSTCESCEKVTDFRCLFLEARQIRYELSPDFLEAYNFMTAYNSWQCPKCEFWNPDFAWRCYKCHYVPGED